MIAFLANILKALEDLANLILHGAVLAINLLFAAVTVLIGTLFSLLPTMSDAPSIGTPTWLQWANWFFPIGDVVSILAALITAYTAFLVVRFALKWVRAL